MTDCGHRCCAVRSNEYHTHLRPPEQCPGCRQLLEENDRFGADVGRIIGTVLTRIVPEIPGLTPSAELTSLVSEYTLVTYQGALADPELFGLGVDQWRTVVAGRVALALAFPD